MLHMDTYLMSVVCFEATKKMRIDKPFNLVVEFRLDLLWGPNWSQKRCHALPIAYCLLPIQARDYIFSDFIRSSLISPGLQAIWACGGKQIGQLVAPCGALWERSHTPLYKMMQ